MRTLSPDDQHEALRAFADVLGRRVEKLRQVRGGWEIAGSKGRICAFPGAWLLLVEDRAWAKAKERIAGTIMRDGAIILTKLPGKEQAEEIRQTLGISSHARPQPTVHQLHG